MASLRWGYKNCRVWPGNGLCDSLIFNLSSSALHKRDSPMIRIHQLKCQYLRSCGTHLWLYDVIGRIHTYLTHNKCNIISGACNQNAQRICLFWHTLYQEHSAKLCINASLHQQCVTVPFWCECLKKADRTQGSKLRKQTSLPLAKGTKGAGFCQLGLHGAWSSRISPRRQGRGCCCARSETRHCQRLDCSVYGCSRQIWLRDSHRY